MDESAIRNPQSDAIAGSAIPLKFHSESKIWEKIF